MVKVDAEGMLAAFLDPMPRYKANGGVWKLSVMREAENPQKYALVAGWAAWDGKKWIAPQYNAETTEYIETDDLMLAAFITASVVGLFEERPTLASIVEKYHRYRKAGRAR